MTSVWCEGQIIDVVVLFLGFGSVALDNSHVLYPWKNLAPEVIAKLIERSREYQCSAVYLERCVLDYQWRGEEELSRVVDEWNVTQILLGLGGTGPVSGGCIAKQV